MTSERSPSVDRIVVRSKKNFLLLASILVASLSLAATTSNALAEDACGGRTNPCPLQRWMRDNMGSKLADGKLDAVATSFDALAAMSPDPSWSDWVKLSKDGAAASRRGGDDGTRAAKAACKSCHDQYKTLYRSRFRTRAVP